MVAEASRRALPPGKGVGVVDVGEVVLLVLVEPRPSVALLKKEAPSALEVVDVWKAGISPRAFSAKM